MKIHCCSCQKQINARLTNGSEIYSHRPDLSEIPFWICDKCGNYVGCHYKTSKPTNPLGVIATPELRKAKTLIHKIMDPIWKDGLMKRRELYNLISDTIGGSFHTAEIKTIEEARKAYRIIRDINNQLRK